ncbi:50S ribosomal protein L35ae [Candidatus Parvarchaeota archaeon]|nr:50S ribosomal protein L35ae [Candidatus Parvarchaeota archaeon]
MEGVVLSCRRGRHTARTNQFILEVDGVSTKAKASVLCGKKATWSSPKGKKKSGIITHAHGNKGKVLARFVSGLPGQAVGTKVKIA